MKRIRFRLSYTRILALGFLAVIIIGGLLLMLPISARNGQWGNPLNCLFTATSATCVTGLVVYDTFTQWTLFGQLVLLLMIQIGGIGFMTVITMFSLFMRRRIGLYERRLLVQSSGSMRLEGILTTMKRILGGTLIFEGIGAALLAVRFCPDMGFWRGLYNAVFHAVSAFCNAGFDLMGKYEKFSSLTQYADDWLVCLTLMLLIVIGGIGFLVWNDILKNGLHFKRYSLHAKLVLTSTAALIGFGWIFFWFSEANGLFANLSTGNRLLRALFQSVTTRTAGFNTVDQASLSAPGFLITVIFMLIGGSPGSTAGGIKTTTLVVALFCAFAAARNDLQIRAFKKRIDARIAIQACAILIIYLSAAAVSLVVLCTIEPFGLKRLLYEVVSAIGTVGLSTGLTPLLQPASKLILMLLMYAGRIGGLSLMLVLAEKKNRVPAERPIEQILVG